jgi:hypothetical protein
MKNTQQKFDVLSRVAQAMGHRLFETQRRAGGEASGTVYVALDTSGEPMTVCNTLKDVARDIAWHIDHRVKNADHHRFELAVEAGSLTWDELFSVAGLATRYGRKRQNNCGSARRFPVCVLRSHVSAFRTRAHERAVSADGPRSRRTWRSHALSAGVVVTEKPAFPVFWL